MASSDTPVMPRVSVCIITYNHEKYLAQALDGVLSQRFEGAMEVLVGEDCSTDGTARVANEYAERHPGTVRVLHRPQNLGLMRNLRATLEECRGDYVALLEGDDYWTDADKLAGQVAFLDAHPDYSISFHQTVWIHDDDSAPPKVWPVLEGFSFGIEDLLRRQFIPTSATLFRRSAFRGFPDWYLEVRIWDWLLHILLAQRGKIGFDPTPRSAYRIHSNNLWAGKPWRSHLEIFAEMCERLDGFVEPSLRPIVRQTWFDHCLWLGREAVVARDWPQARRCASRLWTIAALFDRLPDKASLSLQAFAPRLFALQKALRG